MNLWIKKFVKDPQERNGTLRWKTEIMFENQIILLFIMGLSSGVWSRSSQKPYTLRIPEIACLSVGNWVHYKAYLLSNPMKQFHVGYAPNLLGPVILDTPLGVNVFLTERQLSIIN